MYGVLPRFAWIIGALLGAVLLGSAFALIGINAVYGLIALAGLILFAVFAARFPAAAMGITIVFTALTPWPWGLESGGTFPKLNVEEVPLLLYLVSFPFLYLFAGRRWRPGFAPVYALLIALIVLHSLSFAVGGDLVSLRTFIETYVLGAMALVLFLQESLNGDPKRVVPYIVAVTVLIAVLGLVEHLTLRNPIMENQTITYFIAPKFYRTGGTYRPYVTFPHPSETGTFFALGLPFVAWSFLRRKNLLSLSALLVCVVALLLNGTRGVWVGVAVAGLLTLRISWAILVVAGPFLVAAGWTLYSAFEKSSFVQRVLDPQDLRERFLYWNIALRVAADHPLLGIGRLQFGKVFRDYLKFERNPINFHIGASAVADNAFFSTLSENGVIGLASLLLLFWFVFRTLRNARKSFSSDGLTQEASLVRCFELSIVSYLVTGIFADVNYFERATKFLFVLMALGLSLAGRRSKVVTAIPLSAESLSPVGAQAGSV